MHLLLDQRVAGMVVAAASRTDGRHLAQAQAEGVPVVLLDRRVVGLDADRVYADNGAGAALAMAELIGHGPPPDRLRLLRRRRRTATRRARPLVVDDLVSSGGDRHRAYLRGAGRGRGRAVALPRAVPLRRGGSVRGHPRAARPPDRPTAVFASDSVIALGVLRAISDAGLTVPDRRRRRRRRRARLVPRHHPAALHRDPARRRPRPRRPGAGDAPAGRPGRPCTDVRPADDVPGPRLDRAAPYAPSPAGPVTPGSRRLLALVSSARVRTRANGTRSSRRTRRVPYGRPRGRSGGLRPGMAWPRANARSSRANQAAGSSRSAQIHRTTCQPRSRIRSSRTFSRQRAFVGSSSGARLRGRTSPGRRTPQSRRGFGPGEVDARDDRTTPRHARAAAVRGRGARPGASGPG